MRCPLKAGIDQHLQDCGYAECDMSGCQLWCEAEFEFQTLMHRPGCGLMRKENRAV